jgi:hypothetical protein
LAEIALAPDSVQHRAQAVLQDAEPLATAGPAESLRRHFAFLPRSSAHPGHDTAASGRSTSGPGPARAAG